MPCVASFFTLHPSKIKDFCHLLPREKAQAIIISFTCVLTVGGFFDTLKQPEKPAVSSYRKREDFLERPMKKNDFPSFGTLLFYVHEKSGVDKIGQ